MYHGDRILVKGQDWQRTGVSRRYLLDIWSYSFDIVVAECCGDAFWWEVFHETKVKRDDKVVETEV